ncbi:MAG: 6,7-dimethyl-8-ribityllumazine synthase [Candidatus Neomarinimicrobiota bacterium]|nr:MAG: 6,7-dimethyl-8-ribityllumazine synthase [Candidatus Marinimicrobia bacterium TMED108]RCL89085.1 MAG: 6,7-dimethyl-8-ribityllumazine synthase [bacterium]|tara:strand:+ start:2608 stop:3018 length:411 start_codon:yes stop_codon:yes gene_type:complete
MITIVKSNFNQKVVNGLLDGCIIALKEHEINNINIIEVPGAFEIPYSIKNILSNNKNSTQAIITLGCVIKGETDHYSFISQAVTNSVMDLTLTSKIPILFGVLTCQNAQLAFDRSGSDMKKNKGYEVGQAAIKMIN